MTLFHQRFTASSVPVMPSTGQRNIHEQPLHKSLTCRLHKTLTCRLHKSLTWRLHKSLTWRLHKSLTWRLHKSLTWRLHKTLTSRLHKTLTPQDTEPQTPHVTDLQTPQVTDSTRRWPADSTRHWPADSTRHWLHKTLTCRLHKTLTAQDTDSMRHWPATRKVWNSLCLHLWCRPTLCWTTCTSPSLKHSNRCAATTASNCREDPHVSSTQTVDSHIHKLTIFINCAYHIHKLCTPTFTNCALPCS